MMGQCVRPQQQQEERFAVSLVDWIGPVMTARRALGGRQCILFHEENEAITNIVCVSHDVEEEERVVEIHRC